MQQYRLEFFNRNTLSYVHHDFSENLAIDDDYLSASTTVIEIGATNLVKKGQFIRILRDDSDYFFGVVTDSEPGEYVTRVSFKPFITIFNEEFVFNALFQHYGDLQHSLENTLKFYIDTIYTNTTDTYQKLPISVTVPSSESNHTKTWNFGLEGDTDGLSATVIDMYNVLIVNALKKYGVAIEVIPDFANKQIDLKIGKQTGTVYLDADLDNVTVKTLKCSDMPTGTNKLEVYNSNNYTDVEVYYVHPYGHDPLWDDDGSSDRLSPVIRGIKTAAPDLDATPPITFEMAALLAAYDEFSGIEWDNLIELEVAPNDPLVNPSRLKIGQTVTVYYKSNSYTSILTGKAISFETVTLIFGSERIQYSKRKTSK